MSLAHKKWLIDRATLFGCALAAIALGVASFLFADHFHISSTWVLLVWVSVGFFAAVG